MPWIERLHSGAARDESGCLVWRRARNSRGYGVIYIDGKLHLAHRAAWLAAHGVWPPEGLVLDHICETKACIDVAHLRAVTNRFNVLRSPDSPMNASRRATHCRNGHPYGDDAPRDSHGWRMCQACPTTRKVG